MVGAFLSKGNAPIFLPFQRVSLSLIRLKKAIPIIVLYVIITSIKTNWSIKRFFIGTKIIIQINYNNEKSNFYSCFIYLSGC